MLHFLWKCENLSGEVSHMILGTNDIKESMQDFRSKYRHHGSLRILSWKLPMIPVQCLLPDCSIFLFLWLYLISRNCAASPLSCDLWMSQCHIEKQKYKKLSTVSKGGFNPLGIFLGSFSLLWNKEKCRVLLHVASLGLG